MQNERTSNQSARRRLTAAHPCARPTATRGKGPLARLAHGAACLALVATGDAARAAQVPQVATFSDPIMPLPWNSTYPEAGQAIAADLDGDGCDEVIVTGPASGLVVVLSKFRGGRMQQTQSYFAGTFPYWLGSADFDSDGDADIVTLASGSSSIGVLLGTGTGSLAPPRHSPTVGGALSASLADFDEDGVMDIAVRAPGLVTVHLGLGDGRFATGLNRAAPGQFAPLEGGDFDGDGHVDLVAIDGFSDAYVLWGDGRGLFTQAMPVPGARWTGGFAVSDLDGDGRDDLAVLSGGTFEKSVLVYLGSQHRQFGWAGIHGIAVGTNRIHFADADGDGRVDLIGSGQEVCVLPRLGGADFGPATQVRAGGSEGIALGDFDCDGRVDLALNRRGGLPLLMGNGDGTFGGLEQIRTGLRDNEVRVADVNRDRWPDLLTGDIFGFSVTLGEGGGAFGAPSVTALPSVDGTPLPVHLDSDDSLDLVVGATNNRLATLIGRGDGTFDPPAFFPAGVPTSTVRAGRLNPGSSTDLLVFDMQSASPRIATLVGRGDGALEPPVLHALPIPLGSFELVDVDADGFTDVIGVFEWTNELGVMLCDGAGGLAPMQRYVVGEDPRDVAVVDLDLDGALDLVVASRGNPSLSPFGSLTLLIGQGDGTFVPLAALPTPGAAKFVEARDLDGDGWTDLVVTGSFVSVYQGHPGAAFTLVRQMDPALWNGSATTIADLDTDGLDDLVMFNGGGSIVVFRGLGGFLFDSALSYMGTVAMPSLEAVDLDADGALDLVIPNQTWNSGTLHDPGGVHVQFNLTRR